MTDPEHTQAPATILLMEDDEGIRTAFTFILEDEGYIVFATGTLVAAAECLKENRVDLAIADRSVPGSENGIIDMNKLLAERESAAALLGATATRGAAYENKLFGENGAGRPYMHLDKPFNVDDFIKLVAALIEEARAQAYQQASQPSMIDEA